jgi:hypothetical protein
MGIAPEPPGDPRGSAGESLLSKKTIDRKA